MSTQSVIDKSKAILAKYLFTNNVIVSKTSTSNGFMIYQPSQVPDIAKLERLCDDCNLTFSHQEPQFDAKTGLPVSKERIWIGPPSEGNKFQSENELLSSL